MLTGWSVYTRTSKQKEVEGEAREVAEKRGVVLSGAWATAVCSAMFRSAVLAASNGVGGRTDVDFRRAAGL